jgi:hypothetical protein
VGLEPTASLVLSQGGLPIAYRATITNRTKCPAQDLNLQTFGFKPNRSAVGVPGRKVVPDGIEPPLPGCRPGVVAAGPRDRVSQVDSPGFAPGFPTCGAGVFLLDDEPLFDKAEAVGLEPTSGAMPPPVFKTGSSSGRMTSVIGLQNSSGGWNRTNGLLVQSQASLPTATAPEQNGFQDIQFHAKVRGEGFEPPQPGSKPGGLPLADPRVTRSKVPSGSRTRLASLEGWHLCRSAKSTHDQQSGKGGSRILKAHRSTVFKTAAIANWLVLPFSSKAAVAGIEPASERLTAAHPYQHENHRNVFSRRGRIRTDDLLLPKQADSQTFLRADQQKHPAGVEPAHPVWRTERLPLHHGCQES